jgi:sirohydrochlorin ferrochelatase
MDRLPLYPPLAYLAPGAPAGHHLDMPGQEHGSSARRIDDYAVTPESREELIGGRVLEASPADAPHGDRHFQLDYVLGAHVAPGYEGSTDLLTRTSENWNFATDASIRKKGMDPTTGARYLEELAFEIKHTQRLSDLEERARQLIERGVRRVFVICVEKVAGLHVRIGPVLEWQREQQSWRELGAEETIEDACLVHPLPVKALLSATGADDVIVEALAAKGNRALREREQQSYRRGEDDGYKRGEDDGYKRGEDDGYKRGEDDGYRRGEEHGLRQGIRDLCAALDIALTAEREARLNALDRHALDRLRDALKARRGWPDS